MVERAHTPGPWSCDGFAVPKPDGSAIYIRSEARHWAVGAIYETRGCTNPSLDVGKEESQANASLIAAAPDMFEACLCALGHLTGNMDGDWDAGDPIEQLRAAIAKAEGRANLADANPNTSPLHGESGR